MRIKTTAIHGESFTLGLPIWCKRLLLAVFGLAGIGPLHAQIPAKDPVMACKPAFQKQVVRVDDFVFKTYQNEDDACLQVFQRGNLIFKRTQGNMGWYQIGQAADKDSNTPAIPNGTDITGRGYPNMIVSFYTGGAHCCLMFDVFELKPKFRLIETLDAAHGDLAHFSLIDGTYYLLANDWIFAYWNASFAESPAPDISLRFVDDKQGGHYHLALDKMRRPPPTETEFETMKQNTRASFDADANPLWGGIGSDLWRNMLSLIYDGNEDFAWKLIDDTWPSAREGKTAFISQFCSRLKQSRYRGDLAPNLLHAPAACRNAPTEHR